MGRARGFPKDEVLVEKGNFVVHQDRTARIRRVLDPELVLIEYMDTNETEKAAPWDLQVVGRVEDKDEKNKAADLAEISEQEFSTAKKIHDAIKPLLEMKKRTRADVAKVAEQFDVQTLTVYDWIRNYCDTGHVSALVKRKPGPRLGSTQLTPEVEAIIKDSLNKVHLKDHAPPPMKFIEDVEDRCKLAGLKAPHRNTLRRRLDSTPPAVAARRRGNPDQAQRLSEPMPGSFPTAKNPLECVQIDHCILDIQLVFEETREPIGIRPWLTLVIDVYSRMIVGYFLSLMNPSAFSAGVALYMGIMPKKPLLQQLGLPGRWPIYGKMNSVHADNAREFKGKTLELACEENNITSVLRPLKKARYGAYIERMIGNISQEMQKKVGATQNHADKHRDYDPVKGAGYTLAELECDLVDWIVNSYHVAKHSELNTTPLQKYMEGIMGDGKNPGAGLPPIPADPEKLRLDFLPYEKRIVSNAGVELKSISFYDPVLNKWINARDPESLKDKRKFIFRWDPRSIKFIWFYDPELKRYFRIPTRNPARPDISWSEYEEYSKRLKIEGDNHVDEEAIFAYRQRSRAREQAAKEQTAAARKKDSYKAHAKRMPEATSPGSRTFAATQTPSPTVSNSPHVPTDGVPNKDAPTSGDNEAFGDIEPFDDIDV